MTGLGDEENPKSRVRVLTPFTKVESSFFAVDKDMSVTPEKVDDEPMTVRLGKDQDEPDLPSEDIPKMDDLTDLLSSQKVADASKVKDVK